MTTRSSRPLAPVHAALLAILTLALAGCGSDSGTTGPDGVTLASLAGTWTATQFEFSQADPGPSLPSTDLVAAIP